MRGATMLTEYVSTRILHVTDTMQLDFVPKKQ